LPAQGTIETPRRTMLNLTEMISDYVHETRKLESLPSSTETSFYPDLKTLLNAVLKSERLSFDVMTGTQKAAHARAACLISCSAIGRCSRASMARSSGRIRRLAAPRPGIRLVGDRAAWQVGQ